MNSTCAISLFPQTNITDSETLSLATMPAFLAGKLLWKIFSPIIITLGTFGNVMSIVIMSRMTPGDSTINIFFMAIAVADLIVLYTGVTVNWMESLTDVQLREAWPALHWPVFFLCTCSGSVVSWLLACVTLQRALSVLWPHRVTHIFSTTRVKILIGAIVLFITGLYSHYVYGAYHHFINSNSTALSPCGVVQEMSAYSWFLDNIFSYIDLSVYNVLPFATLIIANAILASKLVRSLSAARKLLAARTGQHVIDRKNVTNSVTLTLLAVSFTFIVLISVYFIMFHFKDQRAQSVEDSARVYLFSTVGYLLADTNSAVNFYLYCLTGRRFRQEFVNILCRGTNCRFQTATPSSLPPSIPCLKK